MKISKKGYYSFVLLILLACVLTGVSLFITSGIFLLTHDPKAIDFLAFYTGATLLMHAPPALYILHEQLLIQQQIAPIAKSVSLFLPFLNPPFIALLFIPLVQLGLQTAYAVWVGINTFLLLVICYLGEQQLKRMKWYYKIVLFLGIITFIPLLTSLLLGQLSLLLCLIFLASWLLLKQKKEFRSGFVLSLLLIKPHLMLMPLLFILLQKRMRLIAGVLTGIVLLMILSFSLIGLSGMRDYFALLNSAFGWNTDYGIDIMAQHSFQTVLLILFQTQQLKDIRLFWIVSFAILMLPTVAAWAPKIPVDPLRFALQYALLIVTLLLTSPHTHFHDLSLLIIVAIIVFSVFSKLKRKQKKIFISLFLFGYIIALAGYLLDLQTQTHSRPIWIVMSVSYLLILWFVLWRSLLQSRKHTV